MNKRIIIGLVAGVTAAMSLAVPAQAAAPKATVVYSSSSYLTSRFSVHGNQLAILACTTVNVVTADGTAGELPYPGCSAHVESDGGIAHSRDESVIAQTMTVHNNVSAPPEVDARLYLSRDREWLGSVDVGTNEYTTNPDRRERYGTRSTNRCITAALGQDASYTGRLDSSLPAVAAGPKSSWYVVDRDGNTVYRVDKAGKLSVLAVLPAVTITVSAAEAKAAGWPSCVVGTKVAFEARPSEVEVGADGTVWVAGRPRLLSGAQARASVIYAVNPTSQKVKVLPQRYSGPVDLAVGARGQLFVARPATGRISVIVNGRSRTYVKLSRVLSVETDDRGRLYAVRDAGPTPKSPAAVLRIS